MLLQSGFVCCRLLTYVLQFIELKVDLIHWVIKPILAVLMTTLISLTLDYALLNLHLPLTLHTVSLLITFMCVYLMTLILVGSFTFKDIKSFISAH